MAKIILSEKVRQRLKELVRILYDNDYFAMLENADKYVQNLRAFALSTPHQTRRQCKNTYYGKWYCTYKAN